MNIICRCVSAFGLLNTCCSLPESLSYRVLSLHERHWKEVDDDEEMSLLIIVFSAVNITFK